MTRIVSFLLSGFLCAELGHAQTLNLQDVLNKAVAHSPKVVDAEYDEGAAKARADEAAATYLPTVGANITHTSNHKFVEMELPLGPTVAEIPQMYALTTGTVQAQWTFFEGLGGYKHHQAQSEAWEASKDDMVWSKFAIVRESTAKFYRVLAAQKVRESAEQNVNALTQHVRDVRSLKSSGAATKYDQLKTESQLSDAESDLLAAQDAEAAAKDQLALLIGIPKLDGVTGAIPIVQLDERKIQKDTSTANRKDLIALSKKADSFGKQYQSTLSTWSPKLSVFANYQEYNMTDDHPLDRSEYKDAYQVGVQMNWILFEGGAAMARSREVFEQKSKAESLYQVKLLQASQEITYWQRMYHQQNSVLRAKQANLARAEESVRLSKSGRSAGVRTNTDLLDAELDLFRSRIAVVNASLGVVEAALNLELASGQELMKGAGH